MSNRNSGKGHKPISGGKYRMSSVLIPTLLVASLFNFFASSHTHKGNKMIVHKLVDLVQQ